MDNLGKIIGQDLLKNKNWLLHLDNTLAHISLFICEYLAKNNTIMVSQPPYVPYLSPYDFFLFPKLRRPMKGRHHSTIEEIKSTSTEKLNEITKNDFLSASRIRKNITINISYP